MMLQDKAAERRLHPRIDHELPVRIAVNGYDFTTSTLNVSCTGACCHIDKYVPPFTKIAVRMKLPLCANNKREESRVDCNGVIVRSVDETKGGFNVAIFFNNITDSQRKKISNYISQFLP